MLPCGPDGGKHSRYRVSLGTVVIMRSGKARLGLVAAAALFSVQPLAAGAQGVAPEIAPIDTGVSYENCAGAKTSSRPFDVREVVATSDAAGTKIDVVLCLVTKLEPIGRVQLRMALFDRRGVMISDNGSVYTLDQTASQADGTVTHYNERAGFGLATMGVDRSDLRPEVLVNVQWTDSDGPHAASQMAPMTFAAK